MTRELTTDVAAALSGDVLRPAIFFEGEFKTEPVRVWSGTGTVLWDGKEWLGAAGFLGIAEIEETTNVVASGTSVSFSGIPLDMLKVAIDEAQQGAAGTIYLAFLNEQYQVINSWLQVFRGRLDVPEIVEDGQTATITITYESRLIDLKVPREWRYTHENQQVLAPGDKGFEYITSIQNMDIQWGA